MACRWELHGGGFSAASALLGSTPIGARLFWGPERRYDSTASDSPRPAKEPEVKQGRITRVASWETSTEKHQRGRIQISWFYPHDSLHILGGLGRRVIRGIWTCKFELGALGASKFSMAFEAAHWDHNELQVPRKQYYISSLAALLGLT